mmetsp:Transcript_3586/g.4649  ORF Transcript_3586/g.4649 Transcript_3586/m.4649 type:complete len:133 (+) Transcript_3586:130-528(+)
MMKIQIALFAVAFIFQNAQGFCPSNSLAMQSKASTKVYASRSNIVMSWPGDRPPQKNPKIKELLMDASFARSDERTDVFEDLPNPTYPWYETYYPTQEEIEAAEQGYDFENPEEWLKENANKAEEPKAVLSN